MKIVIDIDDDDYQFIKDTEFENHVVTGHLYEAVYNGTPLPKGHGRLIDADEIPGDGSWDFSDRLDETPTIIEADKAESEG